MKGLGKHIRLLRKERKLTLVEIAKKTGIDQATLSRMENDRMTGTLESHMKIADVLGIRLPQLYDEVVSKLEEAREKVVRQKLEGFSHSTGAVTELLTTGILHKKMLPVLVKLKSKARTESEECPHLSEKFVYVIKGVVEVSLGKERALLHQGESLYFDASKTHSFRNASKSESLCLSVMTPTTQ